ncbi:DUF2486 family protein [Paraburkholderia sp. FT54]|uniref:DUF2486 family protein n=1 Tax=Paraburkholderia sp. FT54 TaxID=3074437 RepID=UPI0028778A50|nr:DUF2486 family protein [Paraburkholderia sp. FT54]WNC89007.1 DUF2486 family protein [Paraburkholderia sp. FT54]
MSDPNDDSIPVLREVLVQGHPVQARQASGGAAELDGPREPSFKAEPMLAPQPVLTPEQMRSAEPVLAADPLHVQEPAFTSQPPHDPQDAAHAPQPGHPADHHHHPKKRSRAHHAADARHAHDDAFAPSAGVFDRAEPITPLEAGSTVPPDIAREGAGEPPLDLDADVIAERLRRRIAGFLAGDGRSVIEERCRETLQAHTGWLVDQITREVALTLEGEMTSWVREAVAEEIARRASGSA